MLGAFAEGDRTARRTREVTALLVALAAASELQARVDGLVALARWVIEPDQRLPWPPAATGPPAAPAYRRLAVLVLLLERPAIREALVPAIADLLAAGDGVPLFAETGLPNDRGLLHETADRLFRRILPSPRDDRDLSVLLSRLFSRARSLGWLEKMPPELFLRLSELLGLAGGPSTGLMGAVTDAFILVCARVQGLGLSQALRERSRRLPVQQSPFFVLPRAGDRLLSGQAAAADDQPGWRDAVDGCRQELLSVRSKLETTGISVDVVYAMEVIETALHRLERLAAVLLAAPGAERAAAAHGLLVVLVRARLSDRSLRALAYTNLHLLARKLVERAGQTGEHYITATRREYWQLMGTAAGGGVITLGTAAMKVQVAALHLPLFVEGLFASTNYALSFMLIQLCGFTLATKQPSMTAATLAAALGEAAGPERMTQVVSGAARIARSQLAAAAGNVLTVSVAAVMFDNFWYWRHGRAYLDPDKATRVLQSLHPLQSGTIFYAALTGVILWASSLVGGWVENFSVYRRLPQAIAEHRLGLVLGPRLMRGLGDFFARNVSGYGGSIALGVMLGMAHPLALFFGLPIDVRHVTLSTGTLALALAAGDWAGVRDPAALAAMAGIAIIFVLNLSVSFLLALMVAFRAREVPRRDRLSLLSAIARGFLRHPGQFLLPPPSGTRTPP